MDMVVYPADYNGNSTEVVDDSAHICVDTFKVVFAHFHTLTFDMKYQMDVDFYKGACHVLYTGVATLHVF